MAFVSPSETEEQKLREMGLVPAAADSQPHPRTRRDIQRARNREEVTMAFVSPSALVEALQAEAEWLATDGIQTIEITVPEDTSDAVIAAMRDRLVDRLVPDHSAEAYSALTEKIHITREIRV